MRRALGFLLLFVELGGLSGCAVNSLPGNPPAPIVAFENPMRIPPCNRDLVWDQVVDVVDDYFVVLREDPPRQIGDVLTEGRLETRPEIGSTVLEPWKFDAVTAYDKLEGTLQSIRRNALVRMIPDANGYLVEVIVFKELENTRRPMFSKSNAAAFRNDSSLQRFEPIVGEQPVSRGWIPMGRDVNLEQEILCELKERLGT